jgi:hypothetical protein
MLSEAFNRHLATLLNIFDSLCSSDAEIALCLAHLTIRQPNGGAGWNESTVGHAKLKALAFLHSSYKPTAKQLAHYKAVVSSVRLWKARTCV